MKSNKKILALCIDGGGCKGVLPAVIVREIEVREGKKTSDIFQFLAGTSIGSIVVSMLSIKLDANQIVSFFYKKAPEIFKKKWYNLFGLFSPIYSGKAIEKILKDIFKDTNVYGLKNHILIPSFNLKDNSPFLFKSYEKNDYKLWEACRASSSAQLYFPAFKCDSNVFWDGGNTTANNPSMCVYSDLIKIGYKDEDIKILSISCGNLPVKDNPDNYIKCGAIKNLIKTLSTLFESGSEETDYHLKQILGKNYLRINIDLDKNYALDSADNTSLSQMETLAKNWVNKNYKVISNFINNK